MTRLPTHDSPIEHIIKGRLVFSAPALSIWKQSQCGRDCVAQACDDSSARGVGYHYLYFVP